MQNNNEPVRFELISSGGKPILCEVLFTFYSDEWKAHYMVYCEVDDPARLSASRYFPEQVERGDLSNLLPIESDEEWAFVERVIDQALGGVTES